MATRISTGHPDLAPVLGPLDDAQRAAVLAQLEAADAQLDSLYEALVTESGSPWRYDGVVLERSDSGQISIDVVIEESAGKISFSAQLRPRNFFPAEAGMWQPGRPPLQMATDAWDVDGSVAIRFRTRVAGRPFTIQQQVAELPERRYDDPVSAAEAFATVCADLAALARSREATVEAWRPEEPGRVEPAAGSDAASV